MLDLEMDIRNVQIVRLLRRGKESARYVMAKVKCTEILNSDCEKIPIWILELHRFCANTKIT